MKAKLSLLFAGLLVLSLILSASGESGTDKVKKRACQEEWSTSACRKPG